MPLSLAANYLRWLQKDNPTGGVEAYPEIDEQGQTTLPGVYVAGDLTGVPLLKLAAEGGTKVIRHFAADPDFRKASRNKPADARQVLILGAGPAGIAAALECQAQGFDYEVLESSQPFSTIENFPKGKPILAKPNGYAGGGPLRIEDGTKESLLAALKATLNSLLPGKELRLRLGERATSLRRRGGVVEVETSQSRVSALRVVLAIGKSGDARRLLIPGETLPHVYNRLFDPGEFEDQDILVVGGGDSAVEAAIALAGSGNRVRLSYRKAALERPKPENLERFNAWVARGSIQPFYDSTPSEIRLGQVDLAAAQGTVTVPAHHVFVLLGRELPLTFLRRNGIKLAGDRDKSSWIFLAAALAFFTMLYCGKAGVNRNVFAGAQGLWECLSAYLTAPFHVALPGGLANHAWYGSLNFFLGWLGSLVFAIAGPIGLGIMFARRKRYFAWGWPLLKHGYLIAVALGFTAVYVSHALMRNAGWSEGPTYWYSLFYTTTIALFGIRRILVRKTRYIALQTLTLIFVQGFFLFYLPFYGYDQIIAANFPPESYVRREMFPAGQWSSFGFILFWPLNMGDFGKSVFWTWFPMVQTFGLLFLLVKRFGKGAYCGWICSCGGMAETLGDELRHLAPHGKTPKRLENIGQGVLLFAVMVTALGFILGQLPALSGSAAFALAVATLTGTYKLLIDVFFAGIIGFGLYFFWGGRIWCRFGCPLAALMHVYSRFSLYRIVSEKKKCISCNACTKACHMGIDVMNYANKGIPLNDVECVRCSACVQTCPTDTLSFATLAKGDTRNRGRVEVPDHGKDDWRAGIK